MISFSNTLIFSFTKFQSRQSLPFDCFSYIRPYILVIYLLIVLVTILIYSTILDILRLLVTYSFLRKPSQLKTIFRCISQTGQPLFSHAPSIYQSDTSFLIRPLIPSDVALSEFLDNCSSVLLSFQSVTWRPWLCLVVLFVRKREKKMNKKGRKKTKTKRIIAYTTVYFN